jgi:hypothetical protein
VKRAALVPKGTITALGTELGVIRGRLLTTARALASYGLIDGERLRVSKTTGYQHLAADVSVLVALFMEHWATLQHKTPETLASLNEAGGQALALLVAVGLKEQAPVKLGEAAQQRRRAFTLLIQAYDDARRAVLYLRAKSGDAAQIAPSLYAGRRGRRRAAEEVAVASENEEDRPTGPGAVQGDERAVAIDEDAALSSAHPFTS